MVSPTLILAVAAALHAAAGVDAVGTADYQPNRHALRLMMTDPTFLGLVSPCPTLSTRRNVPAEWIRTVFHDAATFDISTGKGGIDGSLKYEIKRPENGGLAIPESLKQFESYKADGLSIADLTVLGGITATLSCGGPEIPFRYGRADVSAANLENLTPLPDQGAHAHAGMFRRMGFNTAEMIKLVACGHTLGGVHADTHPEFTKNVTATFDSTKSGFDNAIAVEFLNGSSKNVLALPKGEGVPGSRTDADIYEIDGNKTMIELASSKKNFDDACGQVFQRLFDEAIPRETVLSEPVEPYRVSVGLEVRRRKETLQLRIGSARSWSNLWKMAGTFKQVNIDYYRRDGTLGNRSDLTIRAMRSSMNGQVNVFDFLTNKPVDPVTGISAVKVSVIMNDGTEFIDTEGANTFPIDDTIGIDTDTAFTCEYKPSTGGNSGLNITVGVLGDETQNVFIMTKYADGTLGPRVKTYFRRSRYNTPYSYYGVFLPDLMAFDGGRGLSAFGAVVVRLDRSESKDYNYGAWYSLLSLGAACNVNSILPNDPIVFDTNPTASTTTTFMSTTTVATSSTMTSTTTTATSLTSTSYETTTSFATSSITSTSSTSVIISSASSSTSLIASASTTPSTQTSTSTALVYSKPGDASSIPPKPTATVKPDGNIVVSGASSLTMAKWAMVLGLLGWIAL
ncbi:heme peroxidase [Chytridium lagenaria]|nr:heme peroxidase [Chytridium lagenaria]